ncbi:unnamed protein product [Clavelina lepadiformis]|uniref:NACHT domain-containing protein n=1 Tax=Clavelina lepadiformis TaxID=159417 RepID=A0ABP0G7E3_CLALP
MEANDIPSTSANNSNDDSQNSINIQQSSVHIGDMYHHTDQRQQRTEYHLQDHRSVRIDQHIQATLHTEDQRTVYYHDNRTTHYHMEQTTSVEPNEPSQLPSSVCDQELYHKLEETLKDRAKILAYGPLEMPVDLNQNIEAVSLEISQLPLDVVASMDLGHFHRRQDFLSRFFVNNPHSSHVPSNSLNPNQLFIAAKFSASQEATQKFGSVMGHDHEKYIETYGNIVGVIGQAGIGKSTLTKLLVKTILEGDMNVQAKYIFHIAFRDVDFTTKCNFFQFLMTSSLCDWEHHDASDKKLLKSLNQCDDVVLIFDGFDEAIITKPKHWASNIYLTGQATAETFIKNIMCGRLLPRAKKLFTSRPRQFYELHHNYIPRFLVSVLGLSEASQKELCQKICGERSGQVMQYLDDNPDISAYCYVPVNCILTMHCIHSCIIEGEEARLKSMTSIMAFALDGFVRSEHMRGHESEVSKLADLAWNGFQKQKIIFSEIDLAEVKISTNTLHSFLNTSVNFHSKMRVGVKILDGDKRSYFAHLIWMEFFVAVKMIFFMTTREFQLWVTKLGENRFEVVAKFVYGFCAEETSERLRRIFSLNDGGSFFRKKNMLKEFLLQFTPICFHNGRNSSDYLSICGWLKEANLIDFNNAVSFVLPKNLSLFGTVLPSDISNFHYHLRSNNDYWLLTVMLNATYLEGTYHRIFHEMATTMQQNTNIKIERVNLFESNISDMDMEAMCRCLPIIRTISIYKCVVTQQQMSKLGQSIGRLEAPMDELRLSDIRLEDSKARDLSTCIHNIRTLSLHNVGISFAGIEFLSNAIELLREPMDEFCINDTKFYDNEVQCLTKCLGNVKSFLMGKSEMSTRGYEILSQGIKSLSKQLDWLVMNDQLGDERAYALSSSICNIRNLKVNGCCITANGTAFLSEAIKNLINPLETVFIHDNKLGNEGGISLSRCIHNIKKLFVNECGLKEEAILHFSNAIAALKQPVEYLDLSRNNFGDEGAVNLSKCIHNIKGSNLSECGITSIGIKALSLSISKASHPLDKIDLGYNKLGDAGALSLSTCLHNIKSLNVASCGISKVGIKALSNAILSLPHPLEGLWVNSNEFGAEGIASLSQSLHKIRRLHVSNCQLTSNDISPLFEAIGRLSTPMEFLTVSQNPLGDQGAFALAECLHKIKKVELRYSKIKKDGIVAISTAIKRLPRPERPDVFNYDF